MIWTPRKSIIVPRRKQGGWMGFYAAGATSGGGGGSYDSVMSALSPVAWWKLDESSGTTATDSSGNGNHAVFSSAPQWGQSAIVNGGGACVLNDQAAGALFPDAVQLLASDTAEYTFAGWIMGRAGHSNNGTFIAGRGYTSGVAWGVLSLHAGSTGSGNAGTGRLAGATRRTSPTGGTGYDIIDPNVSRNLCTDTTRHFIMWRIRSDKSWDLSLDGSTIQTGSHGNTAAAGANTNHARLFADDPGGPSIQPWLSYASHFAVWHRALSDTERGNLWAAGM